MRVIKGQLIDKLKKKDNRSIPVIFIPQFCVVIHSIASGISRGRRKGWLNANNPVCRVWRGGVRGKGSGVDKDMHFTVETASYRIAVLSKMLETNFQQAYYAVRTSKQICREYESGLTILKIHKSTNLALLFIARILCELFVQRFAAVCTIQLVILVIQMTVRRDKFL